MYVCPKCGSYYAGGSPPFCVADGRPLVNVDPSSDKGRQGARAIEEQGKAIARQLRKLKWRRVWSTLITTLITIAAAYVLVTRGFIGVERTRSLSPPTPTPTTTPTPQLTPTPLPQAVYKISGQVTDQKSKSLSGINVVLTGGEKSLTATTDSAGRYSFENLFAGASYAVTPQPSGKIAFTPSSRSLNNLSRDEAAHFTALVDADLFQITGRVTDQTRKSLSGINLTLKGEAANLTTTSDSSGKYAFGNLLAGGSYIITPQANPKVAFAPSSRSINKLSRNEVADFSGVVKLDSYKISGRVTDQDRRPLSGVNITLKGARSLSLSTDSGGNYQFDNLLAGSSYTVTAQPGQKVNFTPPSHSVNKLNRDETADFSGVVKTDLYKISGRVTDQNRKALSGITLTLNGGAGTRSMSTDAAGNYAFNQLVAGGNYTITPQLIDKLTFTPRTRSISDLRRDESADFSVVVQIDEVYKISGRVTNNGNPVGGIHIRLGGSKATSTETNPDGYYSFGNLRAGGDYNIIPTLENGNFTPLSRTINNLRKDESADFAGVVQIIEGYKISGRVTSNGKPMAGVSLALEGTKMTSAMTDGNGRYTFSDLSSGGNYTITPASGKTEFSPQRRSIKNLRKDGSADFSVVVPCTDEDRALARDALLNENAGRWQRQIEADKARVIAAVVSDNLPAGVEPRGVEATADLGQIFYAVTFGDCSPRMVIARYEWQVRILFNGKTKVVAVPGQKVCRKALGIWVCYQS
jgi:hypothetical protein